MRIRMLKTVIRYDGVQFLEDMVFQAEPRVDGHMYLLGYGYKLPHDAWTIDLKDSDVAAFFISESARQRRREEAE